MLETGESSQGSDGHEKISSSGDSSGMAEDGPRAATIRGNARWVRVA